MHLGTTKIYRDLKRHFLWLDMTKDVVNYVARYLTHQQVQAKYERPGGLLQPLKIPKSKWEEVTMEFVLSLSRSSKRYDSIWVIVDQMTKSAYFLPIWTMDPVKKLAKCYLKEIVLLHGVSVSIVSDRYARESYKRVLVHE